MHSVSDILRGGGRPAVAGLAVHDPQSHQPDTAAAPAHLPGAFCLW